MKTGNSVSKYLKEPPTDTIVDRMAAIAAGKVNIESVTDHEQFIFRVLNYIHDLLLGPPEPASDAEIFKALKVKWPEISRTSVHRYISATKLAFSHLGVVNKDYERYFFLQQNIKLYNMAMAANNYLAAERILTARAKYTRLDQVDSERPHPDTYGNHNYYIILKGSDSQSILKLDITAAHKMKPEALADIIREIDSNSFAMQDNIIDEYLRSGDQ